MQKYKCINEHIQTLKLGLWMRFRSEWARLFLIEKNHKHRLQEFVLLLLFDLMEVMMMMMMMKMMIYTGIEATHL